MFHWFFLSEHGLYFSTSGFNGSFLLDMVCIASLQAQIMPSKDEQEKDDVKQHKPYPLMKNQ
jgi:hypothetical protein